MTDLLHAFRGGCAIVAICAALWGWQPAGAQTSSQSEAADSEGAAEDVVAGAMIVRGTYTAGDNQTEWEAAIRDGKPERIVEWRNYADYGNGNVVFSFHDGALMHYAEQSERRTAQGGFRRVELNLSFADGRQTGGRKSIDGQPAPVDQQDIQSARAQADAALQRVAVTRPAWQDTTRSEQGSSFAIMQTPAPSSGPDPQSQRLAGDGNNVIFRCADNLFAILGSSADSLVVAPSGRDPVVLPRQPRGGLYDYLGGGWAAQRRGDLLQLQDTSGRALLCRTGG
jgi:hypothetical protein